MNGLVGLYFSILLSENYQIMCVRRTVVLPYLPRNDDLLEWGLSAAAKGIGDLKTTYHVFQDEIDYILEFIESGKPRRKRLHKKLANIKKITGGELLDLPGGFSII